MPIRLVRLTFVRREDGRVLLICCKRHCVLAVRFQPLVKLILIEDVAFPWFRCRYRPVTEFHVQRSYRDARVLSRFLHRHRLVAVFTYLVIPVLFLLPITSSRSWATTCGRSLNVSSCFSMFFHGLWLETAAKDRNDAPVQMETHGNF